MLIDDSELLAFTVSIAIGISDFNPRTAIVMIICPF